MGGINDNNPLKIKTTLLKWLNLTCHSNIVVCGLPGNANVNISINKEIELICKGFTHCSFVRLNYKRSRLGSKYFTTDLCFGISREIVHVSHHKYKPFTFALQGHGSVDRDLIPPCSPSSDLSHIIPKDYPLG